MTHDPRLDLSIRDVAAHYAHDSKTVYELEYHSRGYDRQRGFNATSLYRIIKEPKVNDDQPNQPPEQ